MAEERSMDAADAGKDPTNTREGMNRIVAALPYMKKASFALQEVLLANLVMIGEIPAPTFHEQRRVEFLENRFTEAGLQNCSTDEMGNALGILPGDEGTASILVAAHVDTVFPETVDHTLTVQPETIRGPGVGDNALGAAVVATLPMILDLLEIRLRCDLILMGTTRNLGRGNLEGLRFFLSRTHLPIRAGVNLEGVPLGLLSHHSAGMVRGEIVCSVPSEYDWTRFWALGAIVTLNEVINRILEIPLPRRPRTSIVLGSVESGTSYDTTPTHAVLRMEIRSESWEMVRQVHRRVEEITAEVSAQTGAEVSLEVIARRKPGGISFTHPLAQNARRIMKALDIQSFLSPRTSELAPFVDRGIPAVSVGLTQGDHIGQPDEYLRIRPIFTGLAQLVGILLAVDQGYCCDDPNLV